jgi:hypothetical protein
VSTAAARSLVSDVPGTLVLDLEMHQVKRVHRSLSSDS